MGLFCGCFSRLFYGISSKEARDLGTVMEQPEQELKQEPPPSYSTLSPNDVVSAKECSPASATHPPTSPSAHQDRGQFVEQVHKGHAVPGCAYCFTQRNSPDDTRQNHEDDSYNENDRDDDDDDDDASHGEGSAAVSASLINNPPAVERDEKGAGSNDSNDGNDGIDNIINDTEEHSYDIQLIEASPFETLPINTAWTRSASPLSCQSSIISFPSTRFTATTVSTNSGPRFSGSRSASLRASLSISLRHPYPSSSPSPRLSIDSHTTTNSQRLHQQRTGSAATPPLPPRPVAAHIRSRERDLTPPDPTFNSPPTRTFPSISSVTSSRLESNSVPPPPYSSHHNDAVYLGRSHAPSHLLGRCRPRSRFRRASQPRGSSESRHPVMRDEWFAQFRTAAGPG